MGVIGGYKFGIMTEWARFSYMESLVFAVLLVSVYGFFVLLAGKKYLR
jgi:hypothetical protein